MATRYEKLADNFRAMILLAFIVVWIRFFLDRIHRIDWIIYLATSLEFAESTEIIFYRRQTQTYADGNQLRVNVIISLRERL